MAQALPYGLTFVGLVGGLVVLLVAPLPGDNLNLLVGGGLLAIAVGSVLHLIARHSGPDERRPDF